jgi:hypothetical protein
LLSYDFKEEVPNTINTYTPTTYFVYRLFHESRVMVSLTEWGMHPTVYFKKKPDIFISVASFFRKCSVGVIFIPLGSLSLVKYPVLYIGSQFFQLLGRAYYSTLWLAIVLGVNPFLNTIFSFYRNCICFSIFYSLFHIVYERTQQNFLL